MFEQLIPSAFWTYLGLYFSTILIGNIAAFSAFLIAFLGGLGPPGLLYVIITVTIADISADTLWYSLGRGLRGTRLGAFIERHLPHKTRISRYVNEGNLKLIYPSKFISSTSAPFLFLVGWSNKVGYKKFFRISLVSIAVWLAAMIIITFTIGSGLLPLKSVEFFRKLEVMAVTAIILYIGIQLLFKFLSKKPAIKNFFKKLVDLSNSNGSN